MRLATSDCAFISAIILGLAGVYSRSAGLTAMWEDILGISAAAFLVLTVLLRRREASVADSRAFAIPRIGLVCGIIAIIAFLLAVCFDLFKR